MIRYILFILLACTSCANRKIRTAEHHHQQQAALQKESRLDSLHTQWLSTQRRLAVTAYEEAITITPSGPFTYHPDSGYRGRAVRVEVRREGLRAERQSTRDSMWHAQQTGYLASDSAGYLQSHTLRHSEMRQTPWRWVAAALALAIVALFLLRRFRR